jgi:4-hydroxybenzoate polyprenyltransferase/geranylgeranylglycerol-phosphate geranylgeranyltransferase
MKYKDKIYAYMEASRPYTVIWCGLVSLAGACIAFKEFPPVTIALLVTFIPMMGWIAGLYLTDFFDRKLDYIQKPHRPIPSGRIHKNEALTIGGIFAIIGFLLSFLLGFYNVLLVFPVAILVFTYGKYTKSQGILGNINRGIVIIAAYFFGVFSTGQHLNSYPLYIWFLSILFFVHDTNSNIIGAIRDMWGDKKGGYSTIPVKYGIKKSMCISLLLSIIYIIMIIALTYYFNFLRFPYRFYILFSIAVSILCIMYILIFSSKKEIDRKKALVAHEFFIAERITLASAFIAGMIYQIIFSLILYIMSLIISLIAQLYLRKSYEFMEKK